MGDDPFLGGPRPTDPIEGMKWDYGHVIAALRAELEEAKTIAEGFANAGAKVAAENQRLKEEVGRLQDRVRMEDYTAAVAEKNAAEQDRNRLREQLEELRKLARQTVKWPWATNPWGEGRIVWLRDQFRKIEQALASAESKSSKEDREEKGAVADTPRCSSGAVVGVRDDNLAPPSKPAKQEGR